MSAKEDSSDDFKGSDKKEEKNVNPNKDIFVPFELPAKGNLFENGCEVITKMIGDGNVFESACYVGADVEIGNGCHIGAGCRIDVPIKLEYDTAVTGPDCAQSLVLHGTPASEDFERQIDELCALGEILFKEEFTNLSNISSKVGAILDVHLTLKKGFRLLLPQFMGLKEFKLSYLPPIRLIVTFPHDYPSQSCPKFTICCSWLTKSKLHLLALELNRLWEENHYEILCCWFLFLQYDTLEYLNISDRLDFSEKYQEIFGKDLSTNKYDTTEVLKDDVRHCDQITDVPESKVSKEKSETSSVKSSTYCCQEQEVGDANDLLSKAEKTFEKVDFERKESYQCKPVCQKLLCYLLEYDALKRNKRFKDSVQDCNVYLQHCKM